MLVFFCSMADAKDKSGYGGGCRPPYDVNDDERKNKGGMATVPTSPRGCWIPRRVDKGVNETAWPVAERVKCGKDP